MLRASRIVMSAVAAATLLIAAPLSGTEKNAGEPDGGPLTVSDVVNMESARGFTFSPDGRWVAWVKAFANKKENKRRRAVYLTNLDRDVTIRITRGKADAYAPGFSPGSSHLAFLRAQGKEKSQIHLYDLSGGEPEKITSVRTGVRRFAWRNNQLILFTAREDSTLRETQLKKKKDDAVIVADQEHYPPVRLFQIDREKKTVKRMTQNQGAITEFAVSPDGMWVVTNENQNVNYRYDYRVPPKQFLHNLELDERWEIFAEPHVDPFGFQWDDEGDGFYCSRRRASDSTDTYVSIRELYYYRLQDERFGRVFRAGDKGLGYFWGVTKGGVVAALADGTRFRIIRAERRGKGHSVKTLSSPTGMPISPLAAERTGQRLVYAVSNASSIPTIMIAEAKGSILEDERKLLDLNEALRKRSLARAEVISWTGALGDVVEGILYYPLGYEEGERYPLIVSLHGGPSGVDRDFFTENWSNYPHLLAGKGAFTLKVNYHGSGNYGLAWIESIKGHYYDYEVPDILSGVDHLIERGLVDEEKLGIMGWSNGSILAIACCLEDTRFKALCAGAGDVNWISDYGNCAFGAGFDNAYFGGPPWEKIDVYIEKSPLFRMAEMETPTLIMFGTRDVNVPTEQGWQHFRALQQIGRTPVRFILFPGQPHGLRKLSYQTRKMNEELAWFERYLLGTYEERNKAYDENSPLAMALEKEQVKRSEYLYGERTVDGVLVPETAEYRGLTVGRFEVTRAQFRQFDPAYHYPQQTGNYPANRVPFEHAVAYCAWLSKQTGRSFRLPTEEEMNRLLKAANSNFPNENNLEYWAGYDATPDDAALLGKKISELEQSRLLIEEVGSFRPVGECSVYDLGGNVAEWVVDAEGEGKVTGLSAVTTRDGRSIYTAPPPRYTGFRVIEEKPADTKE